MQIHYAKAANQLWIHSSTTCITCSYFVDIALLINYTKSVKNKVYILLLLIYKQWPQLIYYCLKSNASSSKEMGHKYAEKVNIQSIENESSRMLYEHMLQQTEENTVL